VERVDLRPEYAEAMNQLLIGEAGRLEPLDDSANEVLLLHGTRPEVVASILEKSLDPKLARAGLFGRGTYFAEHPAKIDQYTTVDARWKGGSRSSENKTIRELHNKLYPEPSWHPGNVS
jgi:hypothetical protein